MMRSLAKKTLQMPGVRHVAEHLRGVAQDRRIRSEERHFEQTALREGIDPRDLRFEAVYEQLRNQLGHRGIAWPPQHQHRPLHIVYASFPTNWDQHNIPPQLETLADVTSYFVTERGFKGRDRAAMRAFIDEDLAAFITDLHRHRPIDLLLSYFSGAEISPGTIEIIKALGIATFAFHWDDRPSFFGRMIDGQRAGPAAVCRHYDLNLTNAPESLLKYRLSGALAAFWPEAANPEHFRPLNLPFKYDVSFIGQRYGVRDKYIRYLRGNGIDVATFGPRWENGELSEDDMVRVYNSSRINLGFGYILNTDNQVCLKGRDFEVPATGAVYLTTYSPHLERLYALGKEIATYTCKEDCLENIRRLLNDPDGCAAMRRSSRAAVLKRHTWVHRVEQILYGTPLPQADPS